MCFVAYKSGYIREKKSAYLVSSNGSALNNQADTIPKADSIKRVEMMPSSRDSNSVGSNSPLKVSPLIYSSKSGIILKPEDLTKTALDSIVADSLKN